MEAVRQARNANSKTARHMAKHEDTPVSYLEDSMSRSVEKMLGAICKNTKAAILSPQDGQGPICVHAKRNGEIALDVGQEAGKAAAAQVLNANLMFITESRGRGRGLIVMEAVGDAATAAGVDALVVTSQAFLISVAEYVRWPKHPKAEKTSQDTENRVYQMMEQAIDPALNHIIRAAVVTSRALKDPALQI